MKKLLLFLVVSAAGVNVKAQCADLFISKYVSMGANNKAIEIYNPTPNAIDMKAGGYYLARYKTPTSSGNTAGPVPAYPNFDDTLHLRGVIPAYGTWVVTNPETTPNGSNFGAICDPYLQSKADQLGNIYGTYGSNVGDPTYFKGSDAITIEKIGGSAPVDIFGRFGDFMSSSNGKPSAWSTTAPYTGGTGMGTWITKGYMMIRKSSVTSGVTSNPSAFNPLAEYDTVAKPVVYQDTLDTWDKLGSHTSSCAVGIAENSEVKSVAFPNPVTGNNLFITSEEAIGSYVVTSLSGQVITEKTLNGKEKNIEIRLDDIAKGMYFIRLKHSGGKFSAIRFTKE